MRRFLIYTYYTYKIKLPGDILHMPMTQREMIKLLKAHGWTKTIGGKSSHVKMSKPGNRPIIIPHGELNMMISYPALFYYTTSEKVPFFITFPDFANSATQGIDTTDALTMASDWLGINVADYLENNRPLPTASTLNEISLSKNNPYPNDLEFDSALSFKSMVFVNLDKYLNGTVKIKKTVTIPKWADRMGADLHINYSATLTEAIAQIKISHDAKLAKR